MSQSAIPTKFSAFLGLCFGLIALPTTLPAQSASSSNQKSKIEIQIPILTASIYPRESGVSQPIFKFKRTVIQSSPTLRVLREYFYPDGKVAARENVEYRDNYLIRFELEELQIGAAGSGAIQRDSARPDKGKIVFEYSKDVSKHSSPSTRTEALQPDTLVNDSMGPFLAMNWDRLQRGEKVTCRYIVVPRKETIGFTFKKESQTTWHGHNVIVVRMEPTSLVISALIDPLHFVMEKDPPHRVFQYTGRTTPKVGEPGHWMDLNAVTVFDW